ncbi:MAG: pyridoxal phosphate-dependent aminotransferase [Prevotellaceae bacterium]|jgi:cystathionine beta-lyase|nr:pyridoxal phosphate-dependent aminotransferase [Prevotellaceae bacterium]
MNYNFDEVVDRRGTDALKVEALKQQWKRSDLLPMWVADMDFRTPPFIMKAIRERLDSGILGYTMPAERWASSIVDWLATRHQWNITPEMLCFSPGIVAGIGLAIRCFTEVGDKVMVMPPVYHPFFLVTQDLQREVVWTPLIQEDDCFRIDFDRFRQNIEGCKLFILCNPHNPGGRVWKKEELQTIARICAEHHVLVISDEIHADLTLPPHQHHSYSTISEDARLNNITFMAISKAFNAPGLSSSYSIIENEALRTRFHQYVKSCELHAGHVFAFAPVVAAYEQGAEWLEQALAYIQGNIDYTERFLAENTPKIKMIRPQASFLIFMDFRALGFANQDELTRFVEDGAHLALNRGDMFGKEGTGFMRINIATPRVVLEKALSQLKAAYDKLP